MAKKLFDAGKGGQARENSFDMTSDAARDSVATTNTESPPPVLVLIALPTANLLL